MRGQLASWPARGSADQYPPHADLVQILDQLGQLNGFTAEQALRAPRGGRTLCARWPCCAVRHIPKQRRGAADDGGYIFGVEADGYVLVRSRTLREGWPQTKGGKPLPVKLHRWVAGCGPDLLACHACDETRCVQRAHVRPTTWSENNSDTHKRKRRRAKARQRG